MTNYDLSLKVFDFLAQAEVGSVVICAGARNAPLVMALGSQKFKIYSFFEERAASFFALGLMRAQNKPVAVITTSGTAVAELLPATIEATYQGLPLILITADRPKSYRGSGSPQTIEQVGLFSNYVESTHDLDVQQENFEFNWSFKKPIHLNMCFDEPLLDHASELAKNKSIQLKKMNVQKDSKLQPTLTANPLVILGGLTEDQLPAVIDFIQKLKAPVYAESLSQLSHHEKIQPYLIKSSDALVKKIFQKQLCDSVIRVGSVPTLRFWRDLEAEFKAIPVLQFSDLNFSGLARPTSVFSISTLNEIQLKLSHANLDFIKKWDSSLQKEKLGLLKKYPCSEPALVKALSGVILEQPLYLGNSLPIRHWDQFSEHPSKEIYANRGANGIDGQVSTYLGWAENFESSFCLIGDLTALYDLASLGLTPQLRKSQKRVVVINNFGGQIFQRVFKNDLFINAHQVQFKAWAELWNWNYQLVLKPDDLAKMQDEHLVVEIQPDVNQTKQFWIDWDEACRKA